MLVKTEVKVKKKYIRVDPEGGQGVVYSSQDLINTAGRLSVISDRSRMFLDMFKTVCPAHFHAFRSHDHS